MNKLVNQHKPAPPVDYVQAGTLFLAAFGLLFLGMLWLAGCL